MGRLPLDGDSRRFLSSDLIAGYLPEAAHPYYVLKKNGFEIDFASPKGNSLRTVYADDIQEEKHLLTQNLSKLNLSS